MTTHYLTRSTTFGCPGCGRTARARCFTAVGKFPGSVNCGPCKRPMIELGNGARAEEILRLKPKLRARAILLAGCRRNGLAHLWKEDLVMRKQRRKGKGRRRYGEGVLPTLFGRPWMNRHDPAQLHKSERRLARGD